MVVRYELLVCFSKCCAKGYHQLIRALQMDKNQVGGFTAYPFHGINVFPMANLPLLQPLQIITDLYHVPNGEHHHLEGRTNCLRKETNLSYKYFLFFFLTFDITFLNSDPKHKNKNQHPKKKNLLGRHLFISTNPERHLKKKWRLLDSLTKCYRAPSGYIKKRNK